MHKMVSLPYKRYLRLTQDDIKVKPESIVNKLEDDIHPEVSTGHTAEKKTENGIFTH